jgi:hypothetical protein
MKIVAQMKNLMMRKPLEIPPHSWLRNKFSCGSNRFNLESGPEWDGQNRGNGFEAKI